jgi:UDP-2,3-diacylglucosamine hydrolase
MATLSRREGRERLAIVAGWGHLPLYLAEAARASGEDPVIIALSNEANQTFDGFETMTTGVGDLAGIERYIRQKGVDRVVMSGAVKRRPDWRDIRPTFHTLLRVPAVVRTLMSGGDDAVLQMVIKLFEGMGCRVIGAHEIAPGLLARTGALTAATPSDEDLRDIEQGMRAALALGELDVGQGAVSVGGRVVALEGVEGTDAILDRVASLRGEGRISTRRKGVLVKLCKPQQDIRADLPAIGISTVENAARAGLAGIAVEAGRALVLDEPAVVAAAQKAGLFVCGIDTTLPKGGL